MRKTFFLTVVIHIFLLNALKAQEAVQTDKEKFVEAESYYLFEEFDEALPIYHKLYRTYPQNYNIAFKIGRCLYESPYEKEKSIQYLKIASENISKDAKSTSFKEYNAPPEALYYLGNAFRVNKNYNDAIEAYEEFLLIADKEEFDFKLVQDQITSCKNIRKASRDTSVYVQKHIFKAPFNDRFSQTHPVISGDGNTFVYVSELQFYDAVFYSVMKNGEWLPPRNLIPELQVDGDIYPTSLSFDGTKMYIYRNDNYDGNIWEASLIDGQWKNLRKLGENVNTKYWESHASVNKEQNRLYFSSNRDGGYGDLDIYVSELQKDGVWGIAKNLGPDINTRYNDDSPYVTSDENKLYFKSYGHYNFGGYDIFYAVKNKNGIFVNPRNLGIEINTSDDETYFIPNDNGNEIFISRFEPGNMGRSDIYALEIFSDDNPRMIPVKFNFEILPDNISLQNLRISLFSHRENKTYTNVLPSFTDGEFEALLPHGTYSVKIEGENIQSFERKIFLPIDYQEDIFAFKATVTPSVPSRPVIKPVELATSQEIKINSQKEIPDKHYTQPDSLSDTLFEGISDDQKMWSREDSLYRVNQRIFDLINEYYSLLIFGKDSLAGSNDKSASLGINLSKNFPDQQLSKEDLINAINFLLKELGFSEQAILKDLHDNQLFGLYNIYEKELVQKRPENHTITFRSASEVKLPYRENELFSYLNYLIAFDLFEKLKEKMQESGMDISLFPEKLPVHDVYSLVDYFIKHFGNNEILMRNLEQLLNELEITHEGFNQKKSGSGGFLLEKYHFVFYVLLGLGILYLVILILKRNGRKREK